MGDECRDDLPGGRDGLASVRQVRVDGFVALWRNQRPHSTDLTDDTATVDALLSAGELELDDHGNLTGVHGLVARPTAHRIERADGVVHTWCALDAIGIPAALAVEAAAVTSCPTCGTELRVTLHHGAPADECDFRLWLPAGPCAHLVEDFCRHANLYCSTEHLASVVMAGTAGRAVTVAEAAAIGRTMWCDVSTVLRDGHGGR